MFKKQKVDFMVIGAQKCGTTSLFKYLTCHPAIHPPSQKEVHFFDFKQDRGIPWYHTHFNFSGDYLNGEASPSYLFHPRVPRALKKYNSRAQLIVILRDPVERAWSHYRMNVTKGRENLDFTQALEKEEERLKLSDPSKPGSGFRHFSYKARGLYADQLKHWYRYFSKDQMQIVNYHRFFKEPWSAVQELYQFLGVPSFHEAPLEFRENKTRSELQLKEEDRKTLEAYFHTPNKDLEALTGISFE